MEKTDALQKAGKAGDQLTAGLNKIIEKYDLPFITHNFGSMCSLQTSAFQQINIDDTKQKKEAYFRKKVMEEMEVAFAVEGILTIAGCKIYTNATQTKEVIEEALKAFDRVFSTFEIANDLL